MGLFSSKKTIVVSSTVYNLAGPEIDRPNYMKSTIFASVLNPETPFLGENLVQSYLSGPGINQRLLFKYAVRIDHPGLPTYSISKATAVDPEIVRPFIVVNSGEYAEIQDVTLADGDYEVWAERYMDENYPDEIDSDWVAEYNQNDHTITIQREGGGTVNFPAGDYDSRGRFIVANYYVTKPLEVQAVVPGSLVTGVLSGLPTDVGYTLDSTSVTATESYHQDQTRVIEKTYTDATPPTSDTDYPSIDTDIDTVLTVKYKDVYNGGDGLSPQTSVTRTIRNVWEYREVYTDTSVDVVVNDLGGGVFETVTTTITGDFLRPMYDYQVDTQDTLQTKVIGGNRVFIYKIGTGNPTLDALSTDVGSPVVAEFYPIIPLRLDDESITEPKFAELYESSKKLYKRATKKQKLSKLVEEVENNEDIDEIDYAYVQWAVSLNTREEECIRYMYSFWKNLIPLHGLPADYITSYQAEIAAYESANGSYTNWILAQSVPSDPLFGTPAPANPSLGSPKTMTLYFRTDHPQLEDWDNRISFSFIDENTYTGLGKIGAKKGDYWIAKADPISWNTSKGVYAFGVGPTPTAKKVTKSNSMAVMEIYHQFAANQYRVLRVYGAVHENFIYKGKAVKITSAEAFDDPDESGFLIPMHYPSLKEAGLVSSTQMATANTFIVFNSYKTFKKKWYETFFGMLFIIIVVVAAAAVIAPQAVGGISGALGTNASVGAGFGLSGTSAVVAGAVTNAIVGIVISQALSFGATAIFGDKWGALIGSLLSFAISFGASGGFNNLATMFQPKNLLALSSALANGYKGFVQASITEMNEELVGIAKETKKQLNEIEDLMRDLVGNALAFDQLSLTDTVKGNESRGGYLPESLDEFIQRTTLTGSDIVDMTLSLVGDFTDLSLTLPRT